MSLLTRKRQLAAKTEDTEGVEETLAAADADYLISEPKVAYDVPMFRRDIVKSTLSKTGQIAGTRMGTITFGLELRGSGTKGTLPQWEVLLRACNFETLAIDELTIGAITGGPFVHHETVTQAVTSASGRVIKETANGTTLLYFVDLGTGTWDGSNGITGGTSGATATPSAYAAAEHNIFEPFSDDIEKIAIGAIAGGPYTEGEIITGGTSAAKGAVFEQTANGAAFLRYFPLPGPVFQSGEVITGGDSGATATSSAVPTQDPNNSLTMAVYEDGRVKQFRGCRGRAKFTCTAGEPVRIDFEFQGVESGLGDEALLSGINYEETVPKQFLSAALTWNTFSAVLATVEIDCANTLAPRVSANSAEGFLSVKISERDWVGSIDPEAVRIVIQDWHTDWFTNEKRLLDFIVGDPTADDGNAFEFYAPKCQINNIEDADRDGIAVDQLSFDLIENDPDVSDDELVLIAF